jgi:SAM-dependent methyltransferase
MSKEEFKKKAISSEFLQTRIKLNNNATNNFEHWSINSFPKILLNATILDLGCGTGKQINLFSPFLSDECNYYGCDISEESLNIAKSQYSFSPKINLIHESFDSVLNTFKNDQYFDLIYSFYALYYTEDLNSLIESIYSKLNKNGVFWVVMPYKNTNKELFSILEKIYLLDEKVKYSINGFSDDVIEISKKIGFKSIDVNLFENNIIFKSKENLIEYVLNTTFYNKKYKDEIIKNISKDFSSPFYLTKEVISIKFVK